MAGEDTSTEPVLNHETTQDLEHVVISPYKTQYTPDVHIYTTFQQTFLNKPDRTALIDSITGESYTFRQAQCHIEAIARCMYRDGFRSGDRLALCCSNCVEYPLFMAATLRLNGIVVGINHILTKDEILHQIEMSQSQFIFTGYNISSKVLAAVEHTQIQVYVHGETKSSKCTTSTADIFTNLSASFPQLPAVCQYDLDPGDTPGFILFSSGTTGLPKPVLLSHTGMLTCSFNIIHPEIRQSSDEQIVYQPMSHVFGMDLITTTFTFGITTFIMPKFDLELYIQLVSKHRVPIIHLVPPVAVMMSKSPLLDKYDMTCVCNIASGAGLIAGTTEKLLVKRLKSHNVRFRQVYGMTETSGIITITPAADHRLADIPTGSVGLLSPNTKAKVVDVTSGRSVGPDLEGEIWVAGPQLMLEYEGRPEATRQTIDSDGWLHTGDLGKYDSRGFFFITDRLKELIKYKGYQVAPMELEQHLQSHLAVQDAGVFSIPDPVAGELPRAWVVKNSGHVVSEEEIQEFINARVAAYKRLRGGIRFVDAVPRSASGKVLRRVMKKSENITSKL